MKKILKLYLLFFIGLFLINSIATAQWEKVTNIDNRYARTNYWLDVYFLPSDPDYGWICGYNGWTLHTTDGGESWSAIQIPIVNQLESIHFPTKNVGYTSGEGLIFKSTNGGTTWFNITPLDNYGEFGTTKILLWGNFFVNEDYGFVIGGGCGNENQVFYRTTDGGETWSKQTYYEYDSKLADLAVESTTGNGWAVSSGLLWKTTNGGRNWSVEGPTGGMDWHEEISYINNSFLVPYSDGCHGSLEGNQSGGMRFSTNGGKTWRNYYTTLSNYGAFLMDEKSGWVCGMDEGIYYTSDAGLTWELINCGIDPGAHLDDIWFIDDTTGWVVGNGIYKYRVPRPLDPDIIVDGELILCKGEIVILKADQNYEDIRWNNGSRYTQINADKPGKYWYYAENKYCDKGYSDTVTVVIKERTPMNLKVEPSLTICQGDTVLIYSQNSFEEYRWNTGDSTEFLKVTQPGTYRLEAINEDGCISEGEVEIDVLENPEIEICCPYNVCYGYEEELSVSEGYDSYKWYRTGDYRVLSETNTYLPENSGRYYCVVTNGNKCSTVSDTMTVTLRNEKNQIEILSSIQRPLDFDRVVFPDDKCRQVKLKNTSNETYVLDFVEFTRKFSFSAPLSQFPIAIPPNDTVSVEVCYWPGQVGIERDTILIPDKCSSHSLPLVAEGAGVDYSGNTKCDIGIILKTVAINKKYSYSSPPYPNPTNSIAYVEFINAGPKDENNQGNCMVYDNLGRLVSQVEPIISSVDTQDDVEIINGYYRIDVKNLVQGVYFITFNVGVETKSYSLIIQK